MPILVILLFIKVAMLLVKVVSGGHAQFYMVLYSLGGHFFVIM